MGGGASVDGTAVKHVAMYNSYIRTGTARAVQLAELVAKLRLDEREAATIFGVYAACCPQLTGLATWERLADVCYLDDRPFLKRAFNLMTTAQRNQPGLNAVELMVGLIRLCTAATSELATIIFDCYATQRVEASEESKPDSKEWTPQHGAYVAISKEDMKVMLIEVNHQTAAEKAESLESRKKKTYAVHMEGLFRQLLSGMHRGAATPVSCEQFIAGLVEGGDEGVTLPARKQVKEIQQATGGEVFWFKLADKVPVHHGELCPPVEIAEPEVHAPTGPRKFDFADKQPSDAEDVPAPETDNVENLDNNNLEEQQEGSLGSLMDDVPDTQIPIEPETKEGPVVVDTQVNVRKSEAAAMEADKKKSVSVQSFDRETTTRRDAETKRTFRMPRRRRKGDNTGRRLCVNKEKPTLQEQRVMDLLDVAKKQSAQVRIAYKLGERRNRTKGRLGAPRS